MNVLLIPTGLLKTFRVFFFLKHFSQCGKGVPGFHFMIYISVAYCSNSFSKNFKATIIFSIYRGLALWEEEGPPPALSPCPFSDQLACLYVIFIPEIVYCLLHNECR